MSTSDLALVTSLYLGKQGVSKASAASLSEYFSKFRISDTTKRMLSVNKSLTLPDTPVIRAQITSADVIHS